MLDPQKIWQAVLGQLELVLSKANFTTWFKNTFVFKVDEDRGEITIGVPNAFTKSWMEKKYNEYILDAVNQICQNRIKKICYQIQTVRKISFAPSDQGPEPKESPTLIVEGEAPRALTPTGEIALNPRYVFTTFVVGSGNQLACSASQAVAEEPGTRYNPLFLYGDVGLGKTHLLQAIGHVIKEKYKDFRILYLNFERFTNDYVAAARRGSFDEFRRLYRSADVLLVDDVQFMIDKEKTQDEFFHTFEALHQNNKQIVITSDRPPKALVELQDRMISRFEWGMIADIKMSDLETRIAILEQKCKERGFPLNAELIDYVARNVKNSIRELEGALNKIIAWYDLSHKPPTLTLVREVLANLFSDPSKNALNPKRIMETVAAFYELTLSDLVGACRKRELVVPRQIVMYLMRRELDCSYPAIGK
ncbi:MAG TPA: chromosomal replication initiator protein DnaA, partial [Candidatus Jacksonbacteria bacterium]|nr:chromosomal replication initiator protein DnaA [Candidatus Jacksonbacteria bacterium]